MLYSLGIYIYILGVKIASLFSSKVRLLLSGHAETFGILGRAININDRYIWVHASSLGEFEQGRPIIERIRQRAPQYKILLTFFSPSGYEVRKHYEGADIVCYMPFDTPRNARRFVSMVRPEKAFFIKYEFWKNFLDELHRSGTEVYSVSSIFRPGQIFFRRWAAPYACVLRDFTHFFVQNGESLRLLSDAGLTNASVTGDTRFDRVTDIRRAARDVPEAAAFVGEAKHLLVAGSSWEPDEDIIIPYFNSHPGLKLILAPHVVSEQHIRRIIGQTARPAIRFSQSAGKDLSAYDCLIIDTYGLLSSLYRYGDIAYVGGGFGVGIHNVPEAAVYGVPVIIGPNHSKFREANDLLALGGALEISSEQTFSMTMDLLMSNEAERSRRGDEAGNYIASNAGASDKVYSAIKW